MARVSKKFVLKNIHLSYVKIVEPGKSFDESRLEYSVQVVIRKEHPQFAELTELRNSILREAFPKATKAQKMSMKTLLRDADEEGRSEEHPYLTGCCFFNAKRREDYGAVPCFDRQARPMTPTHDTIYSGMMANVELTFFSFDGVSKGVSAGLDAIQVVDNTTAERWDGQSTAGGGFTALDPVDSDPAYAKSPSLAVVGSDAGDGTVDDDDIPW